MSIQTARVRHEEGFREGTWRICFKQRGPTPGSFMEVSGVGSRVHTKSPPSKKVSWRVIRFQAGKYPASLFKAVAKLSPGCSSTSPAEGMATSALCFACTLGGGVGWIACWVGCWRACIAVMQSSPYWMRSDIRWTAFGTRFVEENFQLGSLRRQAVAWVAGHEQPIPVLVTPGVDPLLLLLGGCGLGDLLLNALLDLLCVLLEDRLEGLLPVVCHIVEGLLGSVTVGCQPLDCFWWWRLLSGVGCPDLCLPCVDLLPRRWLLGGLLSRSRGLRLCRLLSLLLGPGLPLQKHLLAKLSHLVPAANQVPGVVQAVEDRLIGAVLLEKRVGFLIAVFPPEVAVQGRLGFFRCCLFGCRCFRFRLGLFASGCLRWRPPPRVWVDYPLTVGIRRTSHRRGLLVPQVEYRAGGDLGHRT